MNDETMMRIADCSEELGNDETSVATGDERRLEAGYQNNNVLNERLMY
jgi:hypothetical protein